MLSSIDMKYWIRSGSWEFMQDRSRSRGVSSLNWDGHPIYYRPGSSDMTLIYRILLKPEKKREYRIPATLNPRRILDIGANIGVTARLFAARYPQAEIHCFEPVPANVELLKRNTAPYPNIHVHSVALGSQDGTLEILHSDDNTNFGGFSFYEAGSDPERTIQVPVREAQRFLQEAGIGQADVIKVDTEGAEYDILMSLGREYLRRVAWITGELHGNRDFALLAELEKDFEVAMDKPEGSRLSHFQATARQ